VLLFGDSHAHHLNDFFNVLAEDAQLSLVSSWSPQCQPLKGVEGYEVREVNRSFPVCEAVKAQTFKELHKYQYVVLAGYWAVSENLEKDFFYRKDADAALNRGNNPELLAFGLEQTVAAVIAAGASPILVKDFPILEKTELTCSLRRILVNSGSECALPADKVQQQQLLGDSIIDRIAAAHPQVRIINPRALVCDQQQCQTELNQLPLYRDEDHLNGVASRMLGELYLQRYGNPLKSR